MPQKSLRCYSEGCCFHHVKTFKLLVGIYMRAKAPLSFVPFQNFPSFSVQQVFPIGTSTLDGDEPFEAGFLDFLDRWEKGPSSEISAFCSVDTSLEPEFPFLQYRLGYDGTETPSQLSVFFVLAGDL